MKKQYKARKGASFGDKQAQKFGDRIKTLSAKGEVKPIDLVEDSKLPDSPFFNKFEWDDSIAGKKYRLQQARDILSHIIEVVVVKGERMECRSWHSVNIGTPRVVYAELDTALKKPDYRIEVINRTITALENATNLMKIFKSLQK